MIEQETEQHRRECLERWRKYWRLAQATAALPDRLQRQAAVDRHKADYPWFGDMVRQAWNERRNNRGGTQ